MRNKHIHKWVEVSRQYSAPNAGDYRLKNVSEHTILTYKFGRTVIELKCDECGDIKTYDFIGKSQ